MLAALAPKPGAERAARASRPLLALLLVLLRLPIPDGRLHRRARVRNVQARPHT